MRFLAMLALVCFAQPESGTMTTILGTGAKGHTGDGGLGVKATLNQPFHVEFDPRGALYVAESDSHCIRKLDLKTGIVMTVAGSGKKGYSGDGGPAVAATFNEPYAVVLDPKGNLYVVDRLNAAIRKIDAEGIVTTVAGNGTKGSSGDGGLGVKAQLVEPNDCFLDGKGGLLIADVGDGRVRRLDLDSGVISTFAGIGKVKNKERGDGGSANKAVITGARAVCVDGHGNVYVCEREGNSIRKIDSAGVITTVAGTGKAGYTGDGGDAKMATFKGPKGIRVDAAGNLYVVDTENHAIRKIDAKTNIITTVAGGQKGTGGDGGPANRAGLDRPHGCVVDPAGTLYIADSNNNRVRAVKSE
jgi:streptogramin lyase